MKYAFCCLFLLILISCKQEEIVVADEEEEVLITEDDETDEDKADDEAGSAFPLNLPYNQNTTYRLVPLSIHPSRDGGIYLTGNFSGMNINSNGQVNWKYPPGCFYDRNTKEAFTHQINAGDIRVFQINNIGEAQLLYDFSNDYNIHQSSRIILTDSSIYFYWGSGQGVEKVVNVVSLDLKGKLNWKKELVFGDYIYPELIAHNGLLFLQYGTYGSIARVDEVSVAVISASGNVINDFVLTTNLEEWNRREPLVNIKVDDDYIYSNTTKNDGGLNRKSRIAKYTYSGDLVDEVEVPYVKDFYVEANNIYATGNDYEIDADLRTGYAFVLKLDKNLNLLNNEKLNEFVTASTRITVSNNVIYIAVLSSSSGYYKGDRLLLDTLTLN